MIHTFNKEMKLFHNLCFLLSRNSICSFVCNKNNLFNHTHQILLFTRNGKQQFFRAKIIELLTCRALRATLCVAIKIYELLLSSCETSNFNEMEGNTEHCCISKVENEVLCFTTSTEVTLG